MSTARKSWLRRGVIFLALAVATALHGAPSPAELKAVYIYNFVSFVRWPDDVFHHPADPLVIGVLDAPDVADALAAVANGERVRGHPLTIERLVRPADALDCQVVYVAAGAEDFREWGTLKVRPILTVGDSAVFEAKGGIIRFVMRQNHIRLRINVDQASQARLSISSQLLRIADVRRSRAWRSQPGFGAVFAADLATYARRPPLR